MKLDQALILNRYLHDLFGAQRFRDLKSALDRTEEGPAGDGQTWFFHALAGRQQLHLPDDRLREYDSRVAEYERRLAHARGGFAFKYFQYLALLYTEIVLDRLTGDPSRFLSEINAFLSHLKTREPSLDDVAPFEADDLRRLAFFMATGSGKTLLLHVNLWQVMHYLTDVRHPEALVRRADLRRQFDNIILITPNEGLSRQHLEELRRSGVSAGLLIDAGPRSNLFGPHVNVVEIHKLAEEPSRDGVSVVLDDLGGANLVFVDEGHKGTGSEARVWKNRQRRLSADGFLIEYSATFAQSIGAAGAALKKSLVAEYGKSIVFDYSYRHFFDDGFGKDFRVLNLSRARQDQAHQLLLGGLLVYYQQLRLFRENATAFRPYNLEPPLWVFLGSSVSRKKGTERDTSRTAEQERSDVAIVVAFLRRFLEDPKWAERGISDILSAKSGFSDREAHEDLFARHLSHLRGQQPRALYQHIFRDMFHGSGGLEICELKNADGEFGLRVSVPAGQAPRYFGVINIGDALSFKKHLEENLALTVQEDRFASSLFSEINQPESGVNVLIGAKKFIEGWSSWRVSAMGLLNVGKGEGPQVIQLFGRGVRLKGRHWTLKRTAALPEAGPHPDGIVELETLVIFGWNADYIKQFREMLGREDVLMHEVRVPVRALFEPMPPLLVPKPDETCDLTGATFELAAEPPGIYVDLAPRVTVMTENQEASGETDETVHLDFSDPQVLGLLNLDELYADLLAFKLARRFGNVYVPRAALPGILRTSSVRVLRNDLRRPELIHQAARAALTHYLERFVRRHERKLESRYIRPAPFLVRERAPEYVVRVSSDELLKAIRRVIAKASDLYADGDRPLPRLHVDRHLYSPILLESGDEEVSISPPGLKKDEADFVKGLRTFWARHHNDEPYRRREVFLVRNPARGGVSFFVRSGFSPDFIVWVRDQDTGRTHVQFVEPHGMHHGGISGNQDRIDALRDLEQRNSDSEFRSENLTVSGRILTRTELKHIPGAEHSDWLTLEREHRILRQGGNYIERVLSTPW